MQKKILPIDIPSISPNNLNDFINDFSWCTPYRDYNFISTNLLDAMVSIVSKLSSDPMIRDCYCIKLNDICLDLSRVAMAAVDVNNIRQRTIIPVYCNMTSPLFAFLYTGICNESDNNNLSVPVIFSLEKIRNFMRQIRRNYKMLTIKGDKRFDLIGTNILLNEYLEESPLTAVTLCPELYIRNSVNEQLPVHLMDIIQFIVNRFMEVFGASTESNKDVLERVHNLSKDFVFKHMQHVYKDMKLLLSSDIIPHKADVLISGTPKYLGRLISSYYKSYGKKVYRFTHGGDRAFNDDPTWALKELMFCDEYFCHGEGEAQNIKMRLKEKRIVSLYAENIELIGLGSKGHQYLNHRMEKFHAGASRKIKTKNILYVADAYLGEHYMDFQGCKVGDISYFEWQVWLINTLKRIGYKVVTKFHPGGFFTKNQLLQRYCDKNLFGPKKTQLNFEHFYEQYSPEVFLFDSVETAFFDSLCAVEGLVLIDTGIREFDKNSINDLKERCSIVSCYFDDKNRIRCKESDLKDAIEKQSESKGCSEYFFKKYYNSIKLGHPG